jgi:crossover junction endodeoxyribonuclease RuvC
MCHEEFELTVILGIDPGSRVTGYGVIKSEGQKMSYIDSGCIRTSAGELSPRLLEIFNGICELMEAYRPQEAAIEQVFMHKNVNAALKLGHARGVAMVAVASHRIPIYEYSPRQMKQALVGYGAAQKEQVKQMVMCLLDLKQAPQTDAADALGIAICHRHMHTGLQKLLGI